MVESIGQRSSDKSTGRLHDGVQNEAGWRQLAEGEEHQGHSRVDVASWKTTVVTNEAEYQKVDRDLL